MDIVENELKKISLMKAYSYLNKNPEENLPKLMDWMDAHLDDHVLAKQRAFFRDIIMKKDSNWYRLITSLWTDLDDAVRRTLFENIIINANSYDASRIKKNSDRYKCNIPWIISLDLGDEQNGLGFEKWDDVIDQAKALGTFLFVVGGQEPLQSKEELIALCNKNRDCEFMVITDGSKLDENFIQQILRVKNLIIALTVTEPVMSPELSERTELLRRWKVPYAAMCVYQSENQDRFANESFFDDLVNHGVKLVFFLSAISEEKDKVYAKVKEYRKTKPILSIHFCKDRELIGGCVAGGRYYCNINAKGGVEPCFFVRSSDRTIATGSLLEAFRGPKFLEYYGKCPECPAIEKA
ncbi:MAG: hypothetical protein PUC44_02520 [Eubacteriales bacterium]|nr:hypothetical protein [Eubacteriales bacterium]